MGPASELDPVGKRRAAYEAARREIDRRYREYFAAAEAFGQCLAPDDPTLAEDLWLRWKSPQPFAAKYPDWYRAHHGISPDDPAIDWYAADVVPWSHLHRCLRVRGLVADVPLRSAPRQIVAALDASRMALPDLAVRWAWVTDEAMALDTVDFLAEVGARVEAGRCRCRCR